MSVAPSEALERSVLEGKDREQLLTIAAALGVKPGTRAKKADIIDKILEQVGVPTGAPTAEAPVARKAPARSRAARTNDTGQPALPTLDDAAAATEPVPAAGPETADPAEAPVAEAEVVAVTPAAAPARPAVVLGPDGEPLAEWELDLSDDGEGDDGDDGDDAGSGGAGGQPGAPGEAREGRRRRRRRNRNRTGEDGAAAPAPGQPASAIAPTSPAVERIERAERAERIERPDRPERGDDARLDVEALNNEPVEVAGYVDLREEGFGFLRVHGYLASKDDIYVSVKQVRQYGLRRGDQVSGTSRPAGRNEKNPALLSITGVNGGDPDQARLRRRFDDLTPVFPSTSLPLAVAATADAPTADTTARAIDLVSPMGKGQRALVVAPPRAGRTTVLKSIAIALERSHPDVHVVVLLVDERPEEVTDMRRAVTSEVVASTFDAKPNEHTQVAEMAIERAKRLVEAGRDVVVVVDGLTRLARAYNLAAPATGRALPGGIDAGALHPAKRFFAAARNLEEGGSLTIVATALVDTSSKVDEAILDELKDTANMELRLDRGLADRRIFPAIDVEGSGTRHEEHLVDGARLGAMRALRAQLTGAAGDASAAPVESLHARLARTATNEALLAETAGASA